MKKKDIIKKWLDNDQLNHEESEAFKNLDAYDSYMRISETAKSFKASEYNSEEAYVNLSTALSQHKDRSTSKFKASAWLKIAAVFILLIGTYFTFFNTSSTAIQVAAGQKASIALPDQTTVQLNALSSIKYDKKNWDRDRNVSLRGEAYFKVSKGKKFDVQTSMGVVSVIGTQFNVKQREDYFEVVCYEGIVGVSFKDNQVTLTAGKVFKVVQNKITNTITSQIKPEWTENRSTFKSTPYHHILKEFERQYNVTVTAKNIDQSKLFTGNFVHSDIQTALQSITIPMRLRYMIKDNNVTLYKSDQNQD